MHTTILFLVGITLIALENDYFQTAYATKIVAPITRNSRLKRAELY